jgi:hypothetical protein
VGEPYSIGLGREPEQTAIGIERMAPTRLDELETGLFAAIEEALANPAIHSIHDVQRIGPEARDLHDLGYAARIKALELRAGLDLIEGAQEAIGKIELPAAYRRERRHFVAPGRADQDREGRVIGLNQTHVQYV